MSNRRVLDPNTFGDKIYEKFPQLYRTADKDTKYALKRYVQSANEGGYSYIIEKINELLSFYDHDKVDKDLLPYIFKSFGFPYFNGIPEVYLRNLLPIIGDLFERKGTKEVIEYITSIISGVKSTVKVTKARELDGRLGRMMFGSGVFGNAGHTQGITLYLELDYDTTDEDLPNKEQIIRIIKNFVPFYCFVSVVYSFIYIEDAKLDARDSYRHDHVIETLDEIISEDFYEKTAIFGDALFGRAVFGTCYGGTIYAQDDILDEVHSENADAVILSKEQVCETGALFGEAMFGQALFGDDRRRVIYFDDYRDKYSYQLGTDRVTLSGREHLISDASHVLTEENTFSFTEREESVKIGSGIETDDTASNVGYLPRWSAIFRDGQPMGQSKLGINRPYTLTDYYEDEITYLV